MHSNIGPWSEANILYIDQAQFSHRLNCKADLVLYDIGLGIAANSIATIHHFSQLNWPRSLHIISFETDPSGLIYAVKNLEAFPFIQKHRAMLQSLLENGNYFEQYPSGNHLRWEIRNGDFRESILTTPSPDLIYYDLYSPKVSPELWGYQSFKILNKIISRKNSSDPSTILITYTNSTSARTALLLAGFHVGRGRSTPAKKETTIASNTRENLECPLDLDWLAHWKRSSNPIPYDYPEKEISAVAEKLKATLLRNEETPT